MKFDPRSLLAYFDRLAPRERIIVVAGLPVVFAILFYALVWDPLQASREQAERRIVQNGQALEKMVGLRDRYLQLDDEIARLQSGVLDDRSFNLVAYVQGIITKAGLALREVNPRDRDLGAGYIEKQVEFKLQDIELKQLVELLHRVEKGEKPLRFGRLQIKKKTSDKWRFDVNATVSMLEFAEQPAAAAASGGAT